MEGHRLAKDTQGTDKAGLWNGGESMSEFRRKALARLELRPRLPEFFEQGLGTN